MLYISDATIKAQECYEHSQQMVGSYLTVHFFSSVDQKSGIGRICPFKNLQIACLDASTNSGIYFTDLCPSDDNVWP